MFSEGTLLGSMSLYYESTFCDPAEIKEVSQKHLPLVFFLMVKFITTLAKDTEPPHKGRMLLADQQTGEW